MQQRSNTNTENPRPLKVLHIGNIANNAFVASSILNSNAIESHVLAADYYHTHGCPEWESAEIKGDWGDDFFPAWHKVDLGGYKRPRWFAQGPRYAAIRYLIALNEGRRLTAWVNWRYMIFSRILMTKPFARRVFHRVWNSRYTLPVRRFLRFDHPGPAPGRGKPPFPGMEYALPPKASQRLASLIRTPRQSEVARLRIQYALQSAAWEKEAQQRKLKNLPPPPPLLDPVANFWAEAVHHDVDVHLWRRLFSHYDIVVGYATDGIWPLAAGKPYVALEHGTIRKLPFEVSYFGRQTAAVYQNASAVFITNCDNNRAAEKLGIKNYHFIPHPTTETQIDEQREKAAVLRRKLEAERDCDYIVFHPSRHHWDKEDRDPNWDKGNDRIIEAFAEIVKEHKVRGLLILVEAGQTVAKSKDLIAALGIGSRVLWMKTQPHHSFIRFLLASDVIADQFGPPLSFGGNPPKAMLCSRPVIGVCDNELVRWCFPEPPPILFTPTADIITAELLRLYKDPEARDQLGRRGKEWYAKYYSNAVFLDIFKNVCSQVAQNRSRERAPTG